MVLVGLCSLFVDPRGRSDMSIPVSEALLALGNQRMWRERIAMNGLELLAKLLSVYIVTAASVLKWEGHAPYSDFLCVRLV